MIIEKESLKQTASVFFQFLRRDAYVHYKNLSDYIINFSIIYPTICAICFAYLQTNTYFGTGNAHLGTILFCGNILIVFMIVTYKQTITLLFDLENDRYIDYQITVLSPRLVILERIISTSIFTFFLALPFFPVAKLLLQDNLATSATSWWQVMVILYIGSLCCSAYHQCATLILQHTNQISSLWARVNHFLINFGGFWIPLNTLYAYSWYLGTIAHLNPLIYITEGLRQSIVGGTQFLSFWFCCQMLLLLTVFFTFAAWYQFKKRTDHI
jgi:hypothetical protein